MTKCLCMHAVFLTIWRLLGSRLIAQVMCIVNAIKHSVRCSVMLDLDLVILGGYSMTNVDPCEEKEMDVLC